MRRVVWNHSQGLANKIKIFTSAICRGYMSTIPPKKYLCHGYRAVSLPWLWIAKTRWTNIARSSKELLSQLLSRSSPPSSYYRRSYIFRGLEKSLRDRKLVRLLGKPPLNVFLQRREGAIQESCSLPQIETSENVRRL
jgi:hypothetical protein